MLAQLRTMTASDLRQRVRDKSVFIFGLVVPLALMFVFNLVFGDVDEMTLDPVTVAASAAEDDDLSAVLLDTLTEVPDLDVTVDRVAAAEVQSRAESGEADLGIVLPPDFTETISDGESTDVRIIKGADAGLEASILVSVVRGVVQQLTAAARAAEAGATLDIAPEQLGQVSQQVGAVGPAVTAVAGRTSSEQLDAGGSIVAGQAGLFLLFTVGFGMLALLEERQHGTLARLQSMPMRGGLIPVAKALVSFILGTTATIVLLVVGGWLFDASFGSPLLVFVLVLCVVTAGTSLMFIIIRVARTAEQAGVIQSILAIVLGMAGGAFFPIAATGVRGTVLDANPVSAFTRGLGISASGGELSDLGVPIAIMLGFAAAVLVISRIIPDRGVAAR